MYVFDRLPYFVNIAHRVEIAVFFPIVGFWVKKEGRFSTSGISWDATERRVRRGI